MVRRFSGLDVGSVTCLPLNSREKPYGCIEFIKTENSGQFTLDEVDTCELLTAMVQMELDAVTPLADYAPKDEILLSARRIWVREIHHA